MNFSSWGCHIYYPPRLFSRLSERLRRLRPHLPPENSGGGEARREKLNAGGDVKKSFFLSLLRAKWDECSFRPLPPPPPPPRAVQGQVFLSLSVPHHSNFYNPLYLLLRSVITGHIGSGGSNCKRRRRRLSLSQTPFARNFPPGRRRRKGRERGKAIFSSFTVVAFAPARRNPAADSFVLQPS